jgi:ferredoxin
MADHSVFFDVADKPVRVQTGTLLSEAAQKAGVEIGQPCGGQGRCGRCAVQIVEGQVRRRSSLRLSSDDVAQGLPCMSVSRWIRYSRSRTRKEKDRTQVDF